MGHLHRPKLATCACRDQAMLQGPLALQAMRRFAAQRSCSRCLKPGSAAGAACSCRELTQMLLRAAACCLSLPGGCTRAHRSALNAPMKVSRVVSGGLAAWLALALGGLGGACCAPASGSAPVGAGGELAAETEMPLAASIGVLCGRMLGLDAWDWLVGQAPPPGFSLQPCMAAEMFC